MSTQAARKKTISFSPRSFPDEKSPTCPSLARRGAGAPQAAQRTRPKTGTRATVDPVPEHLRAWAVEKSRPFRRVKTQRFHRSLVSRGLEAPFSCRRIAVVNTPSLLPRAVRAGIPAAPAFSVLSRVRATERSPKTEHPNPFRLFAVLSFSNHPIAAGALHPGIVSTAVQAWRLQHSWRKLP
jgi:hypothetical protein